MRLLRRHRQRCGGNFYFRRGKPIHNDKAKGSAPSYEESSDKFYKHVDDAVARFLRTLFLLGTSAFGGGVVIFLCNDIWSRFAAATGFVEWLKVVVLVGSGAIFAAGVIGCVIWSFVNMAGVANALVLAREQPSPNKMGRVMGWAHKMFGAGAPLWALVVFGFAIAVCLSVAAATALFEQRDWLMLVVQRIVGF